MRILPVYSYTNNINFSAKNKPKENDSSALLTVNEVAEILSQNDKEYKKANTNFYKKYFKNNEMPPQELDKLGRRMQKLGKIGMQYMTDDLDLLLKLSEDKFSDENIKLLYQKIDKFPNKKYWEIKDCIKLYDIEDEYIDTVRRHKKEAVDSAFRIVNSYNYAFNNTDKSIKMMKESPYKNNLIEINDKLKSEYFTRDTSSNPNILGYIAHQNDNINDAFVQQEIEKNIEKFKKCKIVNYNFYYSPSDPMRNPELEEILIMQDVIHTYNNRYLPISRQYPPYRKFDHFEAVDKIAESKCKCSKDNKPEYNQQINEIKKGLIREIIQNDTKFAKNYNNDAKFAPIQDYINKYSKINKKMCRHLYENYYIKQYPEDIQKKCMKIAKDFNTYLLLSADFNINDVNFIHTELGKWKRAGKKETVLPKYIKISNVHEAYIKKEEESTQTIARAQQDDNIIIDSPENVEYALRHEMMHLNDKLIRDWSHDFSDIESYQKGCALIGKQWYREEFINAGMTEKHIDYAYTNKNEFIAVAAEGDFDKYSDEFKDVLVKLGMPRWVFDLDKT